jgi:glycosyltransferase involved in cell wall biosynthesis
MNNPEKPTISVIMSVFCEKEEWLRCSVDSILNQSYDDFELIIVNDNPASPEIRNYLNEYVHSDHRVIIIENKENIGLTKSLNIALSHAKGKYIARMDADDYSCPTRFEKQIKFLEENSNLLALGTWMNYFGIMNKKNKEFRINPSEAKNYLIINTPISHPTAMIRSEVFNLYGIKYNESFRHSQDYELFYQISRIGEISNLPEILLNYRTTESQISQKNNQSQKSLATDLRKEVITDLLGKELIVELDLFNSDKRVISFKKIHRYACKIKKSSPNTYQQLCIIKYVLLMSPKTLSDRISFIFLLLSNPFQQIAFSFRYYLKAFTNQIFLNYKALL